MRPLGYGRNRFADELKQVCNAAGLMHRGRQWRGNRFSDNYPIGALTCQAQTRSTALHSVFRAEAWIYSAGRRPLKLQRCGEPSPRTPHSAVEFNGCRGSGGFCQKCQSFASTFIIRPVLTVMGAASASPLREKLVDEGPGYHQGSMLSFPATVRERFMQGRLSAD